MSRIRAVAFDFNGTLSRDEPILFAVYRELFAEHGCPLSPDDYYGALAGLPAERIIGTWLGVEGKSRAALVEERIERYLELCGDGASVSPAVRAAVAYAAARVPVAVVSGAFRREIEPVLAAAGLAECVQVIVAVEDGLPAKPAPDVYLRAVERLGRGLLPADVVAFEDTEIGVSAAKAAGLRCVAVLGTSLPDRLRGADEIVEAIDVEVVARMLSPGTRPRRA